MRIGIDMDDTITDSYRVIVPKMAEYYNLNKDILYNAKYDYSILDRFPGKDKFLLDNRYDYLLENVNIKDDAKNVINSLYNQGCEIYIITARDHVEYEDAYLATKKCLDKNGIKYTKIVTDSHKKGEVCKKYNINLFIDDAVSNCLDVYNSNIKSIQIKTIFRPTNDKITVLNSWNDIYNFIKCLTGNIIN